MVDHVYLRPDWWFSLHRFFKYRVEKQTPLNTIGLPEHEESGDEGVQRPTLGCWWRWCLGFIWPAPLTALTMTFWCFDLNARLVPAVSFTNGSAHICRTENFRSCVEVIRRLWSLLSALYRKVLFWVRVCLFYTQLTSLIWLRHMTLAFTHVQMILS